MASKRRRLESYENQPSRSPASMVSLPVFRRTESHSSRAFQLPGRLSDSNLDLASDPRASPGLVSALQQIGLDRGRVPPSLASLSFDSTVEEMGISLAEIENHFERVYANLPNDLPSDDFELDTESWVESTAGSDGNTIYLRVTRPVVKGGLLPCIVYLHPGGMTMEHLTTQSTIAGALRWLPPNNGHHPFPLGLTDCCDAVKYVHANREAFGIRNIILQGFDGGANLALSVTLLAKREEWLYQINGVYACAPYISNAYAWLDERKMRDLPSLIENNGYYLHLTPRAYMAHVYTPKTADTSNPLAWPYHATPADLQGLPPHILVMDELDPLRDEGIAYLRNLIKAGVRAVGHVNVGTTHCASLILRKAVPELHQESIRSIVGFAKIS